MGVQGRESRGTVVRQHSTYTHTGKNVYTCRYAHTHSIHLNFEEKREEESDIKTPYYIIIDTTRIYTHMHAHACASGDVAYAEGAKVLARWTDGFWYSGTVTRVAGGR